MSAPNGRGMGTTPKRPATLVLTSAAQTLYSVTTATDVRESDRTQVCETGSENGVLSEDMWLELPNRYRGLLVRAPTFKIGPAEEASSDLLGGDKECSSWETSMPTMQPSGTDTGENEDTESPWSVRKHDMDTAIMWIKREIVSKYYCYCQKLASLVRV